MEGRVINVCMYGSTNIPAVRFKVDDTTTLESLQRRIRDTEGSLREALKRGQTAFELLDSNDRPLSDDSLCVIPSGSYVWVKPVCRTAECVLV